MGIFSKHLFACVLLAGSVSAWQVAAGTKSAPTIRSVTVLGTGSNVEVQVDASAPAVPHAQVLTGPDRLILDFPNFVPAAGLRNISINRGEVKSIRVGLFSSNPSVTRIVVDLKAPQAYQVSPSGKVVVVKFNATQASAAANIPAPAPVKPAPHVEVSFQNGKLSLWANGATLAEVLFEVHRRTGADIPIPAGANQDQVFANFGPAPAREVLASLLNGSRYNFIMVASDTDPTQLRSLLLSPRGASIQPPVSYSAPAAVARVTAEPEPSVEPDPAPDSPVADDPPPQPAQQPPQR